GGLDRGVGVGAVQIADELLHGPAGEIAELVDIGILPGPSVAMEHPAEGHPAEEEIEDDRDEEDDGQQAPARPPAHYHGEISATSMGAGLLAGSPRSAIWVVPTTKPMMAAAASPTARIQNASRQRSSQGWI